MMRAAWFFTVTLVACAHLRSDDESEAAGGGRSTSVSSRQQVLNFTRTTSFNLRECARTAFDTSKLQLLPTTIPGLDAIVIIHYAPLEDRRNLLEKRLKEIGIDPAHEVSWNTAFDDHATATYDCFIGEYDMPPGLLSHGAKSALTYWHVAQMDRSANVLILEDDVKFLADAMSELRGILASVQGKAYDMITLAPDPAAPETTAAAPDPNVCKATDNLYLGQGVGACSAAYLIRPSGAALMLKYLEPGGSGLFEPTDNLIGKAMNSSAGSERENKGYYMAQPFLAKQDVKLKQHTTKTKDKWSNHPLRRWLKDQNHGLLKGVPIWMQNFAADLDPVLDANSILLQQVSFSNQSTVAKPRSFDGKTYRICPLQPLD